MLYLFKSIIVLFLCLFLPFSFAFPGQSETKKKTLREVYAPYFMIGAAVSAGEKQDSDKGDGYNSLANDKENKDLELLKEFSSVTPENAMKLKFIHPSRDLWVWEPADNIVNYAIANDIKVRGHTLLWGVRQPNWIFDHKGTAAEVKDAVRADLKNHINTLVNRYKGKVYCWDVVNEVITRNPDPNSIYRTDEGWYKSYGDASFVRDAFIFARQADPKAKLFYNDFDLAFGDKRRRVIEMIKEQRLIEDGLIDGIGMHGHYSVDKPSIEEIESAIKDFSDLGLDIHITELDIKGSGADHKALANRYEDLFKLFRKHASKISNVTLWGVADNHSWLAENPENSPLLWDKQHRPKKAYYRVLNF